MDRPSGGWSERWPERCTDGQPRAKSRKREAERGRQYQRAFEAATVHDMFNLLSVVIMLPLQWATEFLSKLAKEVVNAMDLSTKEDAQVEVWTIDSLGAAILLDTFV